MDQRNHNGKGLMVSISEEPRSLSPSPHPSGSNGIDGNNNMMMMQHQHQHPHSSGGSNNGGSFSMNMGGSSMPHPGMSAGSGIIGMDNGSESPYVQEQDEDSGEGEVSQFGRSKKPKRKAAPRTSRACCELCFYICETCYLLEPDVFPNPTLYVYLAVACRRQKMRCEGAENPPCRRCISNGQSFHILCFDISHAHALHTCIAFIRGRLCKFRRDAVTPSKVVQSYGLSKGQWSYQSSSDADKFISMLDTDVRKTIRLPTQVC